MEVQAANHAWKRSVEDTPGCSRKSLNSTSNEPMHMYSGHQMGPLDAREWGSLKARLQTGAMLPGSKPLPCNQTFRLGLPDEEVAAVARRSSLAIGFMVRDVEPYLNRNLKAIVMLGEAFGEYWLFFVENDSRDRTRELLLRHMNEMPKDRLRGSFLGNISRAYSVALCPESQRNCAKRIQLLSRLRQSVFDLAWAQPGWDALIMLDFDFAKFQLSEYLQMFALGQRMNASAIVGVSMTRNSRGHCAQYDRTLFGEYRRDLTKFMRDQGCFGAVMNGHSGFPTLFARALRTANPRPSYSNHSSFLKLGANGYNDLVPFNLALEAHGRSLGMPFLVDPRFRPVYPYGEGELYMKNVTLARILWTKPEE